jgi:uncharacterized membrane protein
MENKLYKKTNKGFKVFPRIFKKIGVILVLGTVLLTVLFFVALSKNMLSSEGVHWVGLILVDLLIIGMLFFSLAAEKIEDERIEHIRLRVLSSSILFAVVFTIAMPFAELLVDKIWSGEKIHSLSPQQLIITALLWYNFMFFSLKRKQ